MNGKLKNVVNEKLPPILVVEDDEDLRQAVARFLENAGYFVDQASNGAVALDLLKLQPEKRYFLVTDIKMPQLSGDAMILEAIRLGYQFVSIIVATGEGYVGVSIAKLLADGKAKLLYKPYMAKDLLELIRDVD